MVVLMINGQKIRFLVDSGATVSCIRHPFPLTTKTMSISGCLGKSETKHFTEELAVSMRDLTTEHEFLYLPDCKISLCGRDLMCKLSLSLVFCPEGHKLLTKSQTIALIKQWPWLHTTHENHPDSEKYLNQVPNHIWMTHPNDIGQTKHVVCVELTTDRPINRPQYPMKEQMAGIQETIDGLLMAGVLHETHSEYNMPLFPVKKSDLMNCRMVQDFRPINEVTAGESHPVPDAYIALNNLSPQHQFYIVIDLANAFFTINIMPQEWKHSPGHFNHFLRKDLTDLTLNSKCTLIQYVDGILIAGPTSQDTCYMPPSSF
uniref:Peptidase A2 domain-containing protein n=1 Tax=Periophthalmus magnuspinnatus TaxID=409849 RepID=A0A3B4BIY3_9GOBI